MKRLLAAATALLLAGSLHAAPASPQSVETVLELTKVESMITQMHGNLEPLMRQSLQQAVGNRPISPQEQRALEALPAKFAALMREEMSWAKLKPAYVQLYAESFDQDEIDGLIAFYRTPTGQALIAKMPVVMQKSMALVQSQLQGFFPRMQQAIEETMAEARKPQ